MGNITITEIKKDSYVKIFLDAADKNFAAIGYKEHGLRHAKLTSNIAGNVLAYLNFPKRDVELAQIAGYLHDIGNSIEMHQHTLSGALLAKRFLQRMNMKDSEIIKIVTAIGSHEEKDIVPGSELTAAVILGDKTDVHHTRVRTEKRTGLDEHTRVNLACTNSFLRVDAKSKTVSLELTINTKIIDIGEYFETFLERMLQLKKAANYFKCMFVLYINKNKFL